MSAPRHRWWIAGLLWASACGGPDTTQQVSATDETYTTSAGDEEPEDEAVSEVAPAPPEE